MKYMKYLLLTLSLYAGCSKTEQSYSSRGYKKYCNEKCLKDFKTEVDWVGDLTGKCYCK